MMSQRTSKKNADYVTIMLKLDPLTDKIDEKNDSTSQKLAELKSKNSDST